MRPAKRPRSSTLSETDNPLVKPEIQRHVVSFLSAEDLCQWDLVCRDFLAVGQLQWGLLANSKFGASGSGGKSSWKLGTSLMKKPIFISINDSRDFGCCFGEDGVYEQDSQCATNQSLWVTVSDIDYIDGNCHERRPFPVGPNSIIIRDAETLNYCRAISSPIKGWRVAICGPRGCEILVTSNATQYCAIRGNNKEVWTQTSVLPDEDMKNWNKMETDRAIPVLGCETHLIAATCGRVYLYDIGSPGGGSLLKSKMAVPISEELLRNDDQLSLKNPETLCWSGCKSFFVFFEPTSKLICIWKIDHGIGSIHSLKLISTGLNIRSVVLSESFVVGADEGKVINIWNRESGQPYKEGLCDVPEDKRVDQEELFFPLSMIVLSGDLMVASSHQGGALCVWNLKSGELLKRHNDAFLHNHCDELPDGSDLFGMTYLNGLNTIVGITGFMAAWAFPTNNVIKKRISSIRRRERFIEYANRHCDYSESSSDEPE